jgi:hypothetical protein
MAKYIWIFDQIFLDFMGQSLNFLGILAFLDLAGRIF